MREAVAAHHGIVRVPRSAIERLRQVRHARAELRRRLLRDPSASELAERTGMSQREVARILNLARRTSAWRTR